MPDTRTVSRGLLRNAVRSCELPPVYSIDVPLWDIAADCKTVGRVHMLMPHEVLNCVVAAGEEQSWCSFDNRQAGFADDLSDWGRRLGVDVHGQQPFCCIGLWGDSARCTKGDQVHLLTWTAISGTHRARFLDRSDIQAQAMPLRVLRALYLRCIIRCIIVVASGSSGWQVSEV